MLGRFDALLMRVNRAAIVAMLAAMAAMVFANVVLRFTTDRSILWVEEVSRYLMIWLTFVGAGPVLRYGGHIGIDTLQERYPAQAPYLRAAIFLLLAAFFAFMAWIGAVYASRTWAQTTPVLQVPVGAVYLALPIGFGLLLVHLMLMAAPFVRARRFLHDDSFDPEAVKL